MSDSTGFLENRYQSYYEEDPVDELDELEDRELFVRTFDGELVTGESIHTIENLSDYLSTHSPSGVYFSADRYAEALNFDKESPESTDLVLAVDSRIGGLPYQEQVSLTAERLSNAVERLERDLGLTPRVLFDGGWKFYLWMPDVEATGKIREQVSNYLSATEYDFDQFPSYTSADASRQGVGGDQVRAVAGGWTKFLHSQFVDFAEELREAEDSLAKERLEEYEGIGTKKSAQAYQAITEEFERIRAGNLKINTGLKAVIEKFIEDQMESEAVQADSAIVSGHEVIPLPGSINGETSLRAVELSQEDLIDFDPVQFGAPDHFEENRVKIEVTGPCSVTYDQEMYEFEKGTHEVPELVANFLLSQGVAERTL